MPYTKKIVCLANSRKPGGFCFAGKEFLGDGCYGEWIRPVSAREEGNSGGVSEEEQKFANGSIPKLLNVVAIPLSKPHPFEHQQENHLIQGVNDGGQRWKKTASIGEDELPKLLDEVTGELWVNQGGQNDRVNAEKAASLEESLFLIKPESLVIRVQWKDEHPKGQKPEVRALFSHNGYDYSLAVTDTVAEKKYRGKSAWKKIPHPIPVPVDNVYLCISLGGKSEWGNNCYKLVAAIIGDAD